MLGGAIFDLLHGEWRAYQAGAVRRTLGDDAVSVWVAEIGRRVVGFVGVRVVDEEREMGEIVMVAVDPGAQREGVAPPSQRSRPIGCDAWACRSRWSRPGDDRHAVARRLYEAAGYMALPVVRYFKAL